MYVSAEQVNDPLYISTCFRIGRYAAIPVYRPLTCVVCRRYEFDVTLKVGKQPPKISQAAPHVLHGIERLRNVESRRSLRDQLHQTLGVLLRTRERVEV